MLRPLPCTDSSEAIQDGAEGKKAIRNFLKGNAAPFRIKPGKGKVFYSLLRQHESPANPKPVSCTARSVFAFLFFRKRVFSCRYEFG